MRWPNLPQSVPEWVYCHLRTKWGRTTMGWTCTFTSLSRVGGVNGHLRIRQERETVGWISFVAILSEGEGERGTRVCKISHRSTTGKLYDRLRIRGEILRFGKFWFSATQAQITTCLWIHSHMNVDAQPPKWDAGPCAFGYRILPLACRSWLHACLYMASALDTQNI